MTTQLPCRERLNQIANFHSSMALPPSHDEIEAMARALQAYEQEPVVNDAMALAFHHAITDGSASRDDLDEIKTGLRAALANYPRPAPSIPVLPVAQPVMFIDGDISSEDAEKLAKVIREFNERRRKVSENGAYRENPHPTNECDMLKNKPAPSIPAVPDEIVGWVRDENGDSRDPLFLCGSVKPGMGKAYNSQYFPVKRAAMLNGGKS
jgi:hypothetical protein